MEEKPSIEVLLEHYRSLRERHVSQGNRLWTRFHYFLTVEAALVGVFLTKVAPSDQSSIHLVPFLGFFWTALWYVIASQDLWFYEGFRKKLEVFTLKHIVPAIGDWDEDKQYYSVPGWKKLICFRIPKCGVTTFAAICPLLFFPLWRLLWASG